MPQIGAHLIQSTLDRLVSFGKSRISPQFPKPISRLFGEKKFRHLGRPLFACAHVFGVITQFFKEIFVADQWFFPSTPDAFVYELEVFVVQDPFRFVALWKSFPAGRADTPVQDCART
ncbi:MAG TPA: hypothetical protein PKE31_18025 [Pseudomonadota bacterium]|nr:hypothetical protein [Pseudomonadota bacterium]